MNRFLFWLNVFAGLLNLGLFIFGNHRWYSLACVGLNAAAALYLTYAMRVTVRVERSVRR